MGARPRAPADAYAQAPSTAPIHLVLTTPPLSLLFHPLSQRLTRIEVRDNPGEWVEYHGRSLREGPPEDGEDDVVKTVRRVMGPTYSASAEGGDGEEVLSYPGVAFGVKPTGGGEFRLDGGVGEGREGADRRNCVCRDSVVEDCGYTSPCSDERAGSFGMVASNAPRLARRFARRPAAGGDQGAAGPLE